MFISLILTLNIFFIGMVRLHSNVIRSERKVTNHYSIQVYTAAE